MATFFFWITDLRTDRRHTRPLRLMRQMTVSYTKNPAMIDTRFLPFTPLLGPIFIVIFICYYFRQILITITNKTLSWLVHVG